VAIEIQIVAGEDHAAEASAVLDASWQPPALRYSPAYMQWQLSFPSNIGSGPAVMAYDNNVPVGFSAMTARRLRSGNESWDSGVVSFVAVRPEWRGRGIAAALYEKLLPAVRERGQPILTFGAIGGAGLKVLLRAYSEAGFETIPLGACPAYSCLVQPGKPAAGDWEAHTVSETTAITDLSRGFGPSAIISDPTNAQLRHYLNDPRPRTLVLVRHRATARTGAAWLVQPEITTARGPETIVIVDAVYIPEYDASALPAVLHAAAAWSGKPLPLLVNAPNLGGFDPEALRRHGIRKTGAGFMAYCCSPEPRGFLSAVRTTNLEII